MGAETMLAIARARLYVRTRWPWFALAVLALRPVECDKIKTAAVSKDAVLYFNAEYIDSLKTERVAAVLCHEAMHVMRAHHDRFVATGAPSHLGKLWNIAADCEVNDDLRAAKFDTGDTWYYPQTIGQCDGLTAEVYFAAVLKQPPQQRPQSGGGVGEGECGSGAGNAPDGEPASDGSGADSTPGDGSTTGATPAELQAARAAFAAAVREAESKARGTVGANLSRWADDYNKPPRIRWQDKLRRLVGRSLEVRAGSTDRSFDRTSRRQGAYGFGAGHVVRPRTIDTTPRVAVAIDTSGSMSARDLSSALTELRAILLSRASVVDLVTCDATVSNVTKLKSAAELDKFVRSGGVKGGGGTSFIPVMQHFDALPKAAKPDLLVYLTDGDGTEPTAPPSGFRVVWVVIRNGSRFDSSRLAKSGEVVVIE